MDKLKTFIFWGACWGVVEATLGWLFHFIHFNGATLFLFPFGLMCMMMAYKQTGHLSSTIKVAGVAALIKLTNLFMIPTVPVYYVTNPAVAIFLEGLATWGFCIYVQKKSFLWKTAIPVASILMFGTIVIFMAWQIVMDEYIAYNPSVHIQINLQLLMIWIRSALLQGIMVTGIYFLVKLLPLNISFAKLTNHLSFPFLLIAVLLNILI